MSTNSPRCPKRVNNDSAKAWPSVVCAAILVLSLHRNSYGQVLERFNFFGESNVAPQTTSTADAFSPNLDTPPLLTRGSTAAGSSAFNSFRTTGFQNNGISTANTDYFQFGASAAPGFTLSLTSIEARFGGTASYLPVSTQFAYSIDGGTNFTLIGTSTNVTAYNTAALTTPTTYLLSGVSALQNLSDTVNVLFRFYAAGATATGGFGFLSSDATSANDGLVLNGSTPEPSLAALVSLVSIGLLSRRSRLNLFNNIWRL